MKDSFNFVLQTSYLHVQALALFHGSTWKGAPNIKKMQ